MRCFELFPKRKDVRINKKEKMKLSSFLLAFLLLFQGTYWNMDDVSRMGRLIEHAKFHADTYGDSFIVFLSKHYGELQEEHNNQHQEERSEHEGLPFQNHSCVLVVADLTFLTADYSMSNAVANSNTPQNFHYQENYASLSSFDIFQPPR